MILKLLLTLVLAFVLIVVQSAYATHLTDDVTWQLVMVTSHPTCANYDHQMTNKYSTITEKYLDLYKVENSQYKSLCITEKELKLDFQPAKDLDLLLIVYDKNLGEKILHEEKMGGIYTHSGKNRDLNHAIVFCDCSNFYYSDPTWILTHELSHYVLYLKGYGFDVVEKLVHEFDEKYDQCRVIFEDSCKDIMIKLRVDSMAYSFSVMPPYFPAIGNEPIQQDEISPSTENLGKVITRWWTQGKISEGDYANALGLLSAKDQKLAKNNYEVLFKDGPIDKNQTWQDVILADGSTENSEELIKTIRDKIKNEEQIYVEKNLSGIPDWFKTTATWWLDEKISTKEFVKGIQYLEDSGIIKIH